MIETKRARDHAYYLANKGTIKARVKAWQSANPDKVRSYKATWKRNNPRSWAADLKATIRAKAYQKRHPDRHYEHVKVWRKKNPDLLLSYFHKRRALELNAPGPHFTAPQWQALKIKYKNRCLSCRKTRTLVPDHVIPISKGGSNGIRNIQPLCQSCNSKKWVRDTDYRLSKCAA